MLLPVTMQVCSTLMIRLESSILCALEEEMDHKHSMMSLTNCVCMF